jgi:6-phosphogluconolactonase (cycloisomerase 2 family)
VFAVNAQSGALSPIPESPYPSLTGAGNLDFSWSGNFAYLAACGDGTVGGYSVSRTNGTLSVLRRSPFPSDACPNAIATDVTNLFVANYYANTMSVYRINRSSGGLVAIPGSPFPVGASPASVVIVR